MNIEAFIIGYNVQDTIALTIKHYRRFCSKITFFDNYSTDMSVCAAIDAGANASPFGTSGVLDDEAYKHLKNNCWKGSNADWVIVCDDDEILLHPPGQAEKATIMLTQGFEIFSMQMPENDLLELQNGCLNNNYSKSICFRPAALQDIGFEFGAHVARPIGDVRYSEQIIPVLHYRSIGGYERLIERHRMYNKKERSEANKRWNLGHHYIDISEEQKQKEWLESYEKRVPLQSVFGFLSPEAMPVEAAD